LLVGWSAEVEPEIGQRAGGEGFAAAPPADEGAVGQRDGPDERWRGHWDMVSRAGLVVVRWAQTWARR
jgi:hypothetical protein